MEKILEQGLLFDFYGELLTEHQKKIYGEAVDNDMSLGEIADEYGITRQGVHDLLKRSNHILEEYEEKASAGSKVYRDQGKGQSDSSINKPAGFRSRRAGKAVTPVVR